MEWPKIEIEYHYLPDNGPRKDCWVEIAWEEGNNEPKWIFYYSTSKATGWALPLNF